MSFSPFAILTAEEMNDLVENIESLSDGSGFALDNNVVPASALTTNAITLGYAQITSSFTTTSTSIVQATGLSIAVTIPSGGRRTKITAWSGYVDNGSNAFTNVSLWDGNVGSGTRLAANSILTNSTSRQIPLILMSSYIPPAGAKTYNVGISVTAGTGEINASATSPAFILVEAI